MKNAFSRVWRGVKCTLWMRQDDKFLSLLRSLSGKKAVCLCIKCRLMLYDYFFAGGDFGDGYELWFSNSYIYKSVIIIYQFAGSKTNSHPMNCEKENNLRSKISFSWEFYKILLKWQRKRKTQAGNCDNYKTLIKSKKKTQFHIFRLLHLQNFKSCWYFLLFKKNLRNFVKQVFHKIKFNIFYGMIIKYRVSKFIIKFINPTLPKIVSRKWRSSIALSWDLHKFQHRKLFLFLFSRLSFSLDWNLCKSSSEIK